MTYSFVCKKCGYHCESATKEQRREAEVSHKIRDRFGVVVGCRDMKIHTKTGVMRRGQIVSAFSESST